MEKNKEIQIYTLTHKIPSYGLPDDEYHTPLHCGAALSDGFVCETRDDSGENISVKNQWYLETTGIYWIWKNTDSKYVGQQQFRRRIDIDPIKIPDLLKEYDAILPKPVRIGVSVYNHYDKFHIISDLDLCKTVIDEKYPEYSKDFDRIIKGGSVLYYSNGIITTREKYNGLCDFVFGVLFEYERRMGIKYVEGWIKHGATKTTGQNSHAGELSDAEYQSRVFGYLYERLSTLYIIRNFEKRLEIPYTLMEKGMLL